MFIARDKRKENIAEYILYIWQLEDLFRALNFKQESIYNQFVLPQVNLTEQEREQALEWYMDLVNLLKSEGKESGGHIEHTLHLINDLNDLHLRLLDLPIGREYALFYGQVAPEVAKLKEAMKTENMSDIEVSFRALYSVMLIRMQGKTEEATMAYVKDVLEVVSPFIAGLVSIFHKVERGEIDLYRNTDEK